jgi:aspartyl protease family protein
LSQLKSVKIGDRTLYDVEALIVPNDKAPLLLGQTALAQFGKISIDYKKGTITFE